MTIYDILDKYAEFKTEQAKSSIKPMIYDYSKARKKEPYNKFVDIWKAYYKGNVDGINSDTGFNGVRRFKKERKSMKLPKIIAQKWATTLFTEQFKVTLKDDEETEKFKELERLTRFRSKLNEATVWGYAEGTSAILASADLITNGTGGKVKLDILKYDSLYPVSFSKDDISVIAFAKEEQKDKETVFTISLHTEENGIYTVENIQATVKKGTKNIDFSAVETVINANTYNNPAYCIIKPNTVNDCTEILPFGQSIFADALAPCDDVDLAAAGLRRDVKEGDQVTFIGKDLVLEKVGGEKTEKVFENDGFFIVPQDLMDSDGKKQLFEKRVPEIRATEYRQVIRDSLDWATMSSGLGKGMLDVQIMPTATERVYSEADKMQNKSLHEQYLEGEIIKLVKAMCELSGLTGNPIDASVVNIIWKDSVIVDTEAEKKLALFEIDAGVRGKDEYRVDFYGETPEQAKVKIEEISGKPDLTSLDNFGDWKNEQE